MIQWASSKEVIAKIYSDLNIQTPLRDEDLLEWIFEALEYIRTSVRLEDKRVVLQIEDFKALLPCGVHDINQVAINGYGLTYSTETALQFYKERKADQSQMLYVPTTYTIKYPYIYFGREVGEAEVFYRGVVLDEDGYPLIPDFNELKEACVWYVLYKFTLAKYASGKASFQEVKANQGEFYRLADKAINRMFMPTPDKWDAIAKRWNRAISIKNEIESLFATSSLRQTQRKI
jgi:hypothetical protein